MTHAATEFSSPTPVNPEPVNINPTPIGTGNVQVSVVGINFPEMNPNPDLNVNQALGPANMRLLNPHSLPGANPTSLGVNVEDLNSLNSQQQISPPSNLLVIFLESCSAILQETKIESSTNDTTKLFMQILFCISEDQYANSLLHDSNALYSVYLYHAVGYLLFLPINIKLSLLFIIRN